MRPPRPLPCTGKGGDDVLRVPAMGILAGALVLLAGCAEEAAEPVGQSPEPDATGAIDVPCPAPCPGAGAWDCATPGQTRLCLEVPEAACFTWGVVKSCDDGNACSNDSCDGASGCIHAPRICDDGDICTGVESCDVDTGCVQGPALACNDGLACTGTETCDPDEGCSPGSPPADCCNSDKDCGEGDPCTGEGTCLLDTGTCELIPPPTCDDGNPCNGFESCASGVGCVAGTPITCTDGNACNGVEACDQASGGCVGGAILSCDDGLPCNGLESCDATLGCQPGPALSGCCSSQEECEDGNPCNGIGNCDLETETCHVTTPIPCDDGNPCNGIEDCDAVEGCKGGTPLDCNDDNPCNGLEECDSLTGCSPGLFLVCDDGDACNGLETCDPVAGCHPGTPKVCDDGNACNGVEGCDADGCVAGLPLACDDANACNGLEACDPGVGCTVGEPPACHDDNICNGQELCDPASGCQPGAPLACDDGKECTLDTCDKELGCNFDVQALAGSPCQDGDLCTTDDACSAAGCVGTTADCDDGHACTQDGCNPELGCTHVDLDKACDDENACTLDEACQGGLCLASEAVECNDGNPCTLDACDPIAGECTVAHNDLAPCNDGDLCTAGDACLGGVCGAGTKVDCDDEDVCTTDGCDPLVGCFHELIPCDDGEPCTIDACDSALGCGHEIIEGACEDGDKCSHDDVCIEGVCTGGEPPACDDELDCTEDACDPDSGECAFSVTTGCAISGTCYEEDASSPDDPCVACKPASAPEAWSPISGPSCDDDEACTKEDTCEDGACVGTSYNCDDGIDCTEDLCDGAGDCTFPISQGMCFIAEQCVAAGTPLEEESCLACVPSEIPTTWSPLDGLPCHELSFAAETFCLGGQCAPALCDAGRDDCDDLPYNGCEQDLQTSAEHCGGCDQPCTEDLFCQAGECVSECSASFELCGGACVDPQSDASHCGGCDSPCEDASSSSFGSCTESACGSTPCPGGLFDVDADPANGCEYACEITAGGVEACNALDDDCDGLTDEDFAVDEDPDNCGVCGRSCNHPTVALATCQAGECVIHACAVDTKDANGDPSDGCEVAFDNVTDLWVDVFNFNDAGADGSEDHPYPSLKQAVAAAFAGTTIHVGPGTYEGTFQIVEPGITIEGTATDQVFLEVEDESTGIEITASDVTVRRVTMNGGSRGIHIAGTEEAPVDGVTLEALEIAQVKLPHPTTVPPSICGDYETPIVDGILAEHTTGLQVLDLFVHNLSAPDGTSDTLVASAPCDAGCTETCLAPPGGRVYGVRITDSFDTTVDGVLARQLYGGKGASSDTGWKGGDGGRAAAVWVGDSVFVDVSFVVFYNSGGGTTGHKYNSNSAEKGLGTHLDAVRLRSCNQCSVGHVLGHSLDADGIDILTSRCSLVRVNTSSALTIEHLTAYSIGGGGDAGTLVHVEKDQAFQVKVRNSIIYSGWDYCVRNDTNAIENLVVTYSILNYCDGTSKNATVGVGWKNQNPDFISTGNNDLHLKSYSGGIDSGDPDSPYDLEPGLNGCRVNMGYYGNTSEASVHVSATQGCPPPEEP